MFSDILLDVGFVKIDVLGLCTLDQEYGALRCLENPQNSSILSRTTEIRRFLILSDNSPFFTHVSNLIFNQPCDFVFFMKCQKDTFWVLTFLVFVL